MQVGAHEQQEEFEPMVRPSEDSLAEWSSIGESSPSNTEPSTIDSSNHAHVDTMNAQVNDSRNRSSSWLPRATNVHDDQMITESDETWERADNIRFHSKLPRWKTILRQLRQGVRKGNDVGVVVCGDGAMVDQIQVEAHTHNFQLHKEVYFYQ